MKALKIIVVEDDKMLATIFRMFIKDIGHQLLGIFPDGYQAIEACKKNLPDVVLMDIHIQGEINGLETAQVIQREYNRPVIFLSSDKQENTLRSAIEIQSYGYLMKPIYKTTLATALELAYHKHCYDTANQPSNKKNSFIEKTNDPVLLVVDGKIEFANKPAVDLLKSPEIEYLIDLPLSSFIAKDDQDNVKKQLDFFLKNNIRIEYFTCQIRNLAGEIEEKALIGSISDYQNKKAVQLIIKNMDDK